MAWVYSKASKRYRNTETGRYMSTSQMIRLQDQFIAAQQAKAERLAAQLAARELTVQQWQREFRELVKTSYVDMYALGAGGRKNLTQSDFGRLGQLIRAQYQYADTLTREIIRGEHSERMIAHKTKNYIQTSGQAYERGRAASYGLNLPTYPRNGSQDCRYNCRCNWSITETATEFRAVWIREKGDSCATCLTNASLYSDSNPYIQPKAA